jgi:hypothetical protein
MPLPILTSKYCGSSIWEKSWDSGYLVGKLTGLKIFVMQTFYAITKGN